MEYDEEYEEERGVSLKDIFKVIFNRKWWVIGVTLVVMVATMLLTSFWYNRSNREYSYTFQLVMHDDDLTTYPDNSVFQYQNLRDLSNLQTVKDSNAEFANIDIESMYNKDDIAITRTESTTTSTTKQSKYTYKISIKARYFSSKEVGSRFIRALAELPITKTKSLIETITYDDSLVLFDAENASYEEQIAYLINQQNYILTQYNNLITLVGSNYKAGLDVSLGSYRDQIQNSPLSDSLTEMQNAIKLGNYVRDEKTYIAQAEGRIINYNAQINYNTNKRDQLKVEYSKSVENTSDLVVNEAYSSSLNKLNEEIATWTAEIARINEIMQYIDRENYTGKTEEEITTYYANKTNFENRLLTYRNQLQSASDTLKTVSKIVYNNESQILYTENKMTVSGGMSLVIAAVLGLIVGFLLVSIVICIIDMPKYQRAKYATEEATQSTEPAHPAS
jgi:hypothetical protein